MAWHVALWTRVKRMPALDDALRRIKKTPGKKQAPDWKELKAMLKGLAGDDVVPLSDREQAILNRKKR